MRSSLDRPLVLRSSQIRLPFRPSFWFPDLIPSQSRVGFETFYPFESPDGWVASTCSSDGWTVAFESGWKGKPFSFHPRDGSWRKQVDIHASVFVSIPVSNVGRNGWGLFVFVPRIFLSVPFVFFFFYSPFRSPIGGTFLSTSSLLRILRMVGSSFVSVGWDGHEDLLLPFSLPIGSMHSLADLLPIQRRGGTGQMEGFFPFYRTANPLSSRRW